MKSYLPVNCSIKLLITLMMPAMIPIEITSFAYELTLLYIVILCVIDFFPNLNCYDHNCEFFILKGREILPNCTGAFTKSLQSLV